MAASPNRAVGGPNAPVDDPNRAVGHPNTAVEGPNLPVGHPYNPVGCPNRPVGCPNEMVILSHKSLSPSHKYGLDAADSTLLARETADYEKLVAPSAPPSARSTSCWKKWTASSSASARPNPEPASPKSGKPPASSEISAKPPPQNPRHRHPNHRRVAPGPPPSTVASVCDRR